MAAMPNKVDEQDYLKKPLDVIRQQCAAELGNGGAECVKSVMEAFHGFVMKEEAAAIPLLTPEAWRNDRLAINSLVRFRGMVQDTLDAEFFVGVHKVRETGELIPTLFQDTMQLRPGLEVDEVIPHETMERRRLICVPIPGECSWVTETQGGAPHCHTNEERYKSDNPSQRSKRAADEMEQEGEAGESIGSKCMKESAATEAMDTGDGSVDSQASSLQCTLAYFYANSEAAEPKLNEVVDLIGILSFDPVLSEAGTSATATQQEAPEKGLGLHAEDGADDLSPSLVPRLHVVAWCRAGRLFTPGFGVVRPMPMPAGLETASGMEQAREAVISYLSPCLGGDRLAAEYVLLGLISRVAARTPGSVVGHFPLNLIGPMMGTVAPLLKDRVESLVSRCRRVDVNIPNLETGRWFPHKNYNTNRLVTALLQVSQGTVLLVDETDLQEGQLGPTGLTNLGVLRHLADLMVVSYDFDYYKIDFEADSPFLVLSKTRSILGGTVICEVPMDCTEASSSPAEEAVDAEMLKTLRLYLSSVSELKVEMDDETARQAETEFVSARANGDKKLSQQDLSRWLTLTRLVSASYGQSRINSAKHWARMKTLEGLREARLRRPSPNNPRQGLGSGEVGVADVVSSMGQ